MDKDMLVKGWGSVSGRWHWGRELEEEGLTGLGVNP